MVERCACGSSISSAPDEASIESAVRTHRQQPEHVVWATLQQLEGWFVARQTMPFDQRGDVRRLLS